MAGTIVAEATPAGNKFTLSLLTSGALVGFTATQMISPLILVLASDFDSSVSVVGQLVTAGAFIWAVLGPVSGALSDRYGRRSMLLLGAIIYGGFTLMSSWAGDLPTMFVMRMLAAVGGSLYATNLQTSIPDYFPSKQQGSALGWVNTGGSMAPLIGVPLVAFIADAADWHWSFRVFGILLLLIGVLLHRSLPPIPRQSTARYSVRSTYLSLLRNRPVVGLLVCNTFERMMFAALTTYLAAFLMQSYSLTVGEIAPLISLIAVGTVLSTLAGGRVPGRYNPGTVFALSQGIAGLILLPVAWLTFGPWFSGLLVAGFGAANALSRPGYMWMVTRVGSNIRGAMMGLTVMTNQLGWALGGAVGGLMLVVGGYNGIMMVCCGAGLLAAVSCHLLVRPDVLATIGTNQPPASAADVTGRT